MSIVCFRAALSTVQQIKNLLMTSTDEPSEKLQQYFNNCSQNPTEDIKNRLQEQKEVFIDQFCSASNLNQGEIASQRYQLAVRLYYRVIESMLDSEHERLSETDFSRLLNIGSFHQSLLACSIEVVLVTYGNPSTGAMGCEDSVFSFPWILNVFQLQAYDFFKVLKSFIKAEPKLTGDLIRHLQNVENSILESEAWKKVTEFVLLIYNVFAVQCDKPPPHRSQSLNIFFDKVCRLGYSRLQKLCDMLIVPKELTHRVWTCFEHCITQRPSLMENRHIDQIMMCSIYAICKVVEKEIRFKTIVERYKNLPHSKQEVFKNAYIEKEEYDSIIGFYNKVFMEAMKQFILQFSNSRTTVSKNSGFISL
ncbi:hypothetical protein LOTGIDRAFT_220664 [Lottia gigantea]|uniref:Retinoblastoma-associated protein N-terminal domain-containing protein n=1 Tax=Lottia gigantea TaxID=225164 RepID=V3ZPU4_LOTGI|nr:hypothetical protein LOTGIDRAFT_220664 [Lottia gigantea]ESO86342.1 hypothetical protein LOTGIDRAFT_220664 [Lottia gigantea]